jgi:hypothetical protein
MVLDSKFLVQTWRTQIGIHYTNRSCYLGCEDFRRTGTSPTAPGSGLSTGEHDAAQLFRSALQENALHQLTEFIPLSLVCCELERTTFDRINFHRTRRGHDGRPRVRAGVEQVTLFGETLQQLKILAH